MSAPDHRSRRFILLAASVVVLVVAMASCQNLRRLRPPYHEPAAQPIAKP